MTSVRIESATFSDGYRAQYRRYLPDGEARARLLCLHGIQSHGGWYEGSCRRLSESGHEVIFLDRRGSGLNPLARGDTPSFERLLLDLVEFIDLAPWTSARGPLVLQAVSWGGKLAVALQKWRPGCVDGLILLCPGLFPRVGLPLLTRLQILLAALREPTRMFPIPLDDPRFFTATPRWLEFLRDDPLTLHHATARFLVNSVRLDRYLRSAPAFVTVPTLLLLAGKDRVIRNDRTQRFFQTLAAIDKNVITYGEAEHTLEFEPEPRWFSNEMARWLDRQCLASRLRGQE